MTDFPLVSARGATMRGRLRDATADAHERMHTHEGFGAAAAGTIGVADYRRLLSRLYGFHRPFEDAVRSVSDVFRIDLEIGAAARSSLLLDDLETLGVDRDKASRLPFWSPSLRLASKGSMLGALYVLEGSNLGGVKMARALNGRVGDQAGGGRSFFLGRGQAQGRMWRELLRELEALSEVDGEAARAEDAAVATFAAFEEWMAGWRAENAA